MEEKEAHEVQAASRQRKGAEPKASLALEGDVPQELRCGYSDSHIPFSSCRSMPSCLPEQRAKWQTNRYRVSIRTINKKYKEEKLTSSKRAAHKRGRQSLEQHDADCRMLFLDLPFLPLPVAPPLVPRTLRVFVSFRPDFPSIKFLLPDFVS